MFQLQRVTKIAFLINFSSILGNSQNFTTLNLYRNKKLDLFFFYIYPKIQFTVEVCIVVVCVLTLAY